MKRLTLGLALVTASWVANAATIVTVYRDYNGDGTQQAGEPGIPGATVNAFIAAGTSITGNTGPAGTVSLATAISTAYRFEVTPPTGVQMGGAAANGVRSNVQFITTPGVGDANLNFAASNPAQYCSSAAAADLIAIKNVREQQAGTTAQPSLSSWNYLDDSTGALGAQTDWAVDQSSAGVVGTGAQWGLAYRRRGDVAFSASFVRGASPLTGSLAEESTGKIYRSTRSSAGVISTALYIDLNAAAYGSIDLGGNPHPRNVVTNYDTLPLAAREETGKFGLGDIDLSDDETLLYAVNLFQKELLVIPMGSDLVPSTPASDATIQRITIPKPASCVNADDFRPFAIGVNDGTVYVGAVCTAQNVTPIANQLDATRRAAMRGYILALNAAGTAISATPLLEFPLNYNRQFSNDGAGFIDSGNWLPWNDAPGYPGGNYGSAGFYSNPQAILSDLAFDNFGFLTIALSDRLNFQVFDAEARYAGEMLLACENGSGGFNLESNGSCTARGVTRTSLDPTANGVAPDDNLNSGPGGREFYFGERYNYTLSDPATDSDMNGPDFHRESASGALALLGGQGSVVTTSYDIGDTFNNGVRVMNQGNLAATTGGLMFQAGGYNSSNSAPSAPSNTTYHEYRLVEGNTSFGKGNGLGDVEVLCESTQPIQVGNLIFNDANSNGIQDAGETGFANIPVQLRDSAGAIVAVALTNANGNYLFTLIEADTTDAAVPSDIVDTSANRTAANLYGQNFFIYIPGINASGVGTNAVPGGSPAGAVALANTRSLTIVNFNSGAGSDLRDSEGVVVDPDGAGAIAAAGGTLVSISAFPTSNYTFDIGLEPTAAALNSLGNRVFYDINNDGIFNGTDSGIAGVQVQLFDSTGVAVDDPHQAGVQAYLLTTDALGYYRFDDLPNDPNTGVAGQQNYVVNVLASNFSTGNALSNFANSTGNSTTTDARDWGVDNVNFLTQGISSTAVTLTAGSVAATDTETGLTASSGNGPSGDSSDDLRVDFGFVATLDFGDLPDSGLGTGAGNYETLSASGGAQNTIDATIRLGATIDGETNGVPSLFANADNAAAANDEDGVTVTNAIRNGAGNAPTLTLNVTNTSGAQINLCAYADLNNDGVFSAAESFITTVANNTTGANVAATFTGTISPGQTFTNDRLYVRTRLQTGMCNPIGDGGNGEVEDIAIPVSTTDAQIDGLGLFCPGQSVTFTITYRNTAAVATATAFPITSDLIGTDQVNLAGVPQFATANWAVTGVTSGASAVITSGTADINTTVTIPAGGTVVITVQGTIANSVNTARTVGANIAPAIAAVDSTLADDSSAASSTLNPSCNTTPQGNGALCPNLTATGNGPQNILASPPTTISAATTSPNTYYPATASKVAGSRCLEVGTLNPAGNTTPVAIGNQLLVIQMQGAMISPDNDGSYGDGGTPGAPGGAQSATAGTYEYVIAQSDRQVTGTGICSAFNNVIEISGAGPGVGGSRGLINDYFNDTTGTERRVFQVVRVPYSSSITFSSTGSYTATAWNGFSGGILAVDSVGAVDLGGAGARFIADGAGFRGATCATQTGVSTADLFATPAVAASGGKGEGYAGSPTNGGYSNGNFGRGAPGNAGGGGQRCGDEGNGRISGGGGGAGGGSGGIGGEDTTDAGCTLTGHGGGPLPSFDNVLRMIPGGGGGAGATNNITCPANAAAGNGGGIVIIRANSITGSGGSISANGSVQIAALSNNLAGAGGGGGGTVVLTTNLSGGTTYAGTTVNANGGAGRGGTSSSGGGGGGGGGRIFFSQTAAAITGTFTATEGAGGAQNGARDGAQGIVVAIPSTSTLDPVNNSPGVKPAFICAQNATVPVTLSNVEVLESGSDLVVNFHTASEAGTLGYRVLADIGKGVQARVEIGSVASKTIDSLKEQAYSVRARNPGADQVWIEESAVDGKATLYGPYKVGSSVGEVGLAQPLNWAAVNAEQSSFRAAQGLALRALSEQSAEIRVSSDGWLRIAHAQLAAAGVDLSGQQANNIAVRLGSETVSARVSLAAKTFGPGSTIEFFAKAVQNSLYTKTAVYRIEAGRNLGMAEIDARTTGLSVGPEVQAVADTLVLNSNTTYSFSSPLEDPWFSFRALRSGGASVGVGSINFTLKDRVAPAVGDGLTKPSDPNVGSETIEVSFWGGLDYAGATPDHNAVFKLNGVTLGAVQFDGFAARVERFALPSGLLLNGKNTFTVELPNSTGYAADIVNVESVAVGYTRTLSTQTDRFSVLLPATPAANATKAAEGADQINASTFVVTGLSGAPVVAVLERGGVQSVLKTDAISAGSLRIELAAQAGDRLSLMPVNNSVLPSAATPLEDPIAGGQARYLIISHPSFIPNLGSFVLAKQSQGFSVKVVDVEAIYRYYSAGVVDPAAIQLAIRRANQNLQTTHVLLVGGDTYDYQNVLGVNSVSFIPTNYRRTSPIIAFAPSDAVYADTDGNGVPNVAIGRWPVRTLAELNVLLGKTLSYQNTRKALFISDRSLNGVSYANQAAPLASLLGQNWTTSQLSLDSYASGQAATARADIVSNLESGTSLLSYYGHSAPASWSREGLITANQVSGGLFNTVNQPFTTVQLGCWGTYFVEPTSTTVAHQMLLMPKGAAAVLGATSLTESSSDIALANHLLPRLSTTTLGEALVQSQQAVATELPEAKDVILGGALLGDPALR